MIQLDESASDINLQRDFAEGITLSWNVDAYVKNETSLIQKIKRSCSKASKADRQRNDSSITHILKQVSGVAKPGEICAIMGASGAGKTSLLNIINHRNRKGYIIEDDIRVNGAKVDPHEMPYYSGYVQQSDHFTGTFTVREQLTFYAMLKMDKKLTTKQKYERVDELLNQLNLIKCKDTKIGFAKFQSGVSGGEKRRLAFAAEILNNPPLLFADEPTSGLDTFMALTVVEILLDLAKQGKTLICTIHQPSSQIFEKFDKLCLLANGRVAYMGPRKDAFAYFSKLGLRCPQMYNPSDYYIRILSIKSTMREKDTMKANRICDEYDRSVFKKSILSQMLQDCEHGRKIKNKPRANYVEQFKWLIWREFLNVLRNPIATYILLGQTIIMSIFNGLIYLQLKLNQRNVQSLKGLLFLMLLQSNVAYMFSVINIYPVELVVIITELKTSTYSAVTYFVSKQIAELPKLVLFPFILITVMFWMSGMSDSVSVYFILTAIFVLTAQVAIGFAVLASVISRNAHGIINAIVPITMILSGIFINYNSIPGYLVWIKYLSWFYYSYEAASVEFWKTIHTIPCTRSSLVVNSTNSCLAQFCYRDGDDVLASLSMNKTNVNRNVGILIAFAFGFRIIALIILKIKTSLL